MRATIGSYGVRISAAHLAAGSKLMKVPNFSRLIEFIGNSIASGYSATYEAFSGFGYMIIAGLLDVDFDVTAHPGICPHEANC